jgi:hypothetical protein
LRVHTFFSAAIVLLLNQLDRFGPVTKGLENLPNGVKEVIVTTTFATRPVIASTGAMLLFGQ